MSDVGLLCCNAMWTCRYVTLFWRNMLLPSFGINHWYLPTSLHGVVMQVININIFTAVRASHLNVLQNTHVTAPNSKAYVLCLLQADEDPPHAYSQVFVLKPLGNSFFCQHDIFRLGIHDTAWRMSTSRNTKWIQKALLLLWLVVVMDVLPVHGIWTPNE